MNELEKNAMEISQEKFNSIMQEINDFVTLKIVELLEFAENIGKFFT